MARINKAMVSDHALAAWINAAVKNGVEDTANDLSNFITYNRKNGWLDDESDDQLELILNALLLAKVYQNANLFTRNLKR